MEPNICTGDVANSATYITRQDIVNFPFPYKLWLMVSLDFCDFLRWNRDGTVVLLDLTALEDFLNSPRSIFRIKNSSVFLQHLDEFKFERLNATPEAGEDILLQYKNENFQRHRMDLLAKVRRYTYQLIGDNSVPNTDCDEELKSADLKQTPQSAINSRVASRMLGDLCFMFHGGLSNIQKSRLRFQTVFNFQNETRLLHEKLKASDEKAARNRRGRVDGSARSSLADDDPVIEIPMELFENPHDSVLNLGEDFRPEYAGYYGNCSKETITNFFGEFLPMYEDGSMEIRKIIANNSKSTNNILSSGNQSVCITQPSYSIQIDPNAVVSSTSGEFQSIADLNYSSALEPIFKTEVEQEEPFEMNTDWVNSTQINPKNTTDIDADISMEEFIKFKDPLALDNNVPEQHDVEELENFNEICEGSYVACSSQSAGGERFPQMPLDVKMEIEEDNNVENEAHFRNFFSQYRASLNLLYERQ